jgi:hypothetical protein
MLFAGKVDRVVLGFFKKRFDMGEYKTLRIPKELQLGRVSAWIATEEGSGAIWVPAIKATAMQWGMNHAMKRRKRLQTQAAERIPLDIKLWLEDKGYNCLEDAS